MKLIHAKPFSITEIAKRFQEIDASQVFYQNIETERLDLDAFKDENGEWTTDPVEELPYKIVNEKKALPTEFGVVYGFRQWLRTAFFQDVAMKPKSSPYPSRPVHYLHGVFIWSYQIPPSSDQSEDVGKTQFLPLPVASSWFGAFMGFCKYKDHIVQVNPAELFSIRFLRTKGISIDFNKVISEVRVIDISEDSYTWLYNQFCYYMSVFMGDHFESGPLIERGLLPRDLKDHFLAKHYDSIKYLINRTCHRADIISQLPELGYVVEFGRSMDLDREFSNKLNPSDSAPKTITYWKEKYKKSHNLHVFTNGGYMKVHKYDVDIDKEDLDLSEDLVRLSNYLRALSRKKVCSIAISTLLDELLRHQVYSPGILKRKSFINDNLIPDAKSVGYISERHIDRTFNKDTGKSSRVTHIKFTKKSKRSPK